MNTIFGLSALRPSAKPKQATQIIHKPITLFFTVIISNFPNSYF